jgi:primosomal protein N' (replication factor Y)
LAKALRAYLHDRILGPETPSIARIRNRYLENILIKLPKDKPNTDYKIKIMDTVQNFSIQNAYKSVRIVIDVDPV